MNYQRIIFKRRYENSPNLVAVLNNPSSAPFTRIYIHKRGLEKTFGTLNEAASHALDVMPRVTYANPQPRTVIAMVWGDNGKRAIDIFSFDERIQSSKLGRPISIREGHIEKDPKTLCEDYKEITKAERDHREKSSSIEVYRALPPMFTGLDAIAT